jgi:hypothetical protein
MNLVEELKSSNLDLREEIKGLQIALNTQRGSSASIISDVQLKKLE